MPLYKCQPSDYLNKEIENGLIILVNATQCSLIDPSSGRVSNSDNNVQIQSGQLMRVHCPRASTTKKFKKTNRIFATVAAPNKKIFLCSILDIKLVKIL